MKNLTNFFNFKAKTPPTPGECKSLRFLGLILLMLVMSIGQVFSAEMAAGSRKPKTESVENAPAKDKANQESVEPIAVNTNVNLSGQHAVQLITQKEKETNWAMIIAIISVVANILIVIITHVLQIRLKHLETDEIRTQKIQEAELGQQALMFNKLKDIDNFMAAHDEALWPTDGKRDARLLTELTNKINAAEEFHGQNTMYIRGRLGEQTSALFDKYKEMIRVGRNAGIINEVQKLLEDYLDVYHNHPEKIKEKKQKNNS